MFALPAVLALQARQSDDEPCRFVDICAFGGIGGANPIGPPVGGWGCQWFGVTQTGKSASRYGLIYKLWLTNRNDEESFDVEKIYSFTGGGPGAYPATGLTLLGNKFWGATSSDGANDFGTLYSINTNGAGFAPRLSFSRIVGTFPLSMIGGPDGNLYGVAGSGGSSTNGTVFEGDLKGGAFHWGFGGDGKATYNFGPASGENPSGRLTLGSFNPITNGAQPILPLYGVTSFGGTNGSGASGDGTVYKLGSNGSGFQSLHVFSTQFSADGFLPMGGMALADNMLYGTTSGGGSNYTGTVFKMDTNGNSYTVLRHFSSAIYNPDTLSVTNSDGDSPQGDLILSRNLLFGTTYDGGPKGGGTVWSMNTNGNDFRVLHSFGTPQFDASKSIYTNRGGGWLKAGVTLSGHTLLGATSSGGTNGSGTLFAIILPTPPPPIHIARSGGNVDISWPSHATNFVLQVNSDLATTNWSGFRGAVNDNGTNKIVSIVPTARTAFFRLMNTNAP